MTTLLLLSALGGGNGLGGACGGGGAKDALIAELSAKLAGMTAEKYADSVGVNTFKEVLNRFDKLEDRYGRNFKDIFDELVRLGKAEVANGKDFECLSKELDYRFEAARRETRANDRELAHAIEVESERRVREDEHIREWVGCNFVRNKKVVPTEDFCPPVRLADGTASNQRTVSVQLIGDTTTTTTTTDTPATGA